MTDIEIADQATLEPINKIAESIGLDDDQIEQYGKYKAKISLPVAEKTGKKHKLVLVTSINPTPAGEGKSTVLVGLGGCLEPIEPPNNYCNAGTFYGPRVRNQRWGNRWRL